MRIIPKKIKVKNTVWKCYSMPDIIVALIMFSIIFIAITKGVWAIAVIGGLLSIVMFMPTQDGIFYACILDNLKFLFAKKSYTSTAVKDKERIETLIGIKALKENGIIEYKRLFRSGNQSGAKEFRDRGRKRTEYRYRLFFSRFETVGRNAERGTRENRSTRESGRICRRAVRAA